MSKTLEKVQARHWVAFADDERNLDNGIIVTLKDGYCFADDPGCGVRGFDTAAEALKGTTRASIMGYITTQPIGA